MRHWKFFIICVFLTELSFVLGQDKQDCEPILKFVSDFAKIINAIPRNTYPVSKVCSDEKVHSLYVNASESFKNATSDPSCAHQFQDNKINWIQLLHDQLQFIWQSANCQDCVDHRNETLEFFNQWEELNQCIQQQQSNHTTLCKACNGNYSQVQTYYETLPSVQKRHVCFDIEDQMNQTRHDWSAKYGCCKDKQKSQINFIIYAVSICSLPVIFCGVMIFLTVRRERRELAAEPPLLDDNNIENEDQPVESSSEPQPGSSQKSRANGSVSSLEKSIIDNPENESKLNNLDKNGPREANLLDLSNDNSPLELNIDRNAQGKPFDDGDDVSILDSRKAKVDANKILF